MKHTLVSSSAAKTNTGFLLCGEKCLEEVNVDREVAGAGAAAGKDCTRVGGSSLW